MLPKKRPLVKIRKATVKQPATPAVPVLPTARTWKVHKLALEAHAQEQQTAKKK